MLFGCATRRQNNPIALLLATGRGIARVARSRVVVGATVVVRVVVATVRVGVCQGEAHENAMEAMTQKSADLQLYDEPLFELVPPGVL